MDLQEQLNIIKQRTANIFSEEELIEKLKRSIKRKRPLRVKLGIDPTGPIIHLGISVTLKKLRQFQELGHQVIFIIGDYTTRIGDPSGCDKTRPVLTEDEIKKNSKTYIEQAGKILDVERIEVRRNSEWFGDMGFSDAIKLMGKTTVARMLERDSFDLRRKKGIPISLYELMYPLMQAYDSCQISADIELGGTDQTFNLLMGRDLQKGFGKAPQICITMPILEAADGKKMSKSEGNTIGITEPPKEMLGKIMSIPDKLMESYFELLTEVPIDKAKRLIEENPRDAKAYLARNIVSYFHGEGASLKAQEDFDRVFRDKELPHDIEEVPIPKDKLKDGKIWIVALVTHCGFASSSSEARRLIFQGAVSIDGKQIEEVDTNIAVTDGLVLKVGKRKIAKLKKI